MRICAGLREEDLQGFTVALPAGRCRKPWQARRERDPGTAGSLQRVLLRCSGIRRQCLQPLFAPELPGRHAGRGRRQVETVRMAQLLVRVGNPSVSGADGPERRPRLGQGATCDPSADADHLRPEQHRLRQPDAADRLLHAADGPRAKTAVRLSQQRGPADLRLQLAGELRPVCQHRRTDGTAPGLGDRGLRRLLHAAGTPSWRGYRARRSPARPTVT